MRTLIAFALVAAPALFAGYDTATATATASAKIIQPITLSRYWDLNFGGIYSPTASDQVTMNPFTWGRTAATDPTILRAAEGGNPAAFYYTKDNGYSFNVTLPTTVTLNGPGGATMVADTFTADQTSYAYGSSGYVMVGATLHVGAGQAGGAYSGNFNVTVTYN